jgi:hypothetical protein
MTFLNTGELSAFLDQMRLSRCDKVASGNNEQLA